MSLFGKKNVCAACGLRGVSREGNLWICSRCGANGPLLAGLAVDLGLRGNPRRGSSERYRPGVSVAAQLLPVIPTLAPVAASAELAVALDDAYYLWFHDFAGTAFDIDDPDVEQAEATWVRNRLAEPDLRVDDARFYVVSMVTSAGWQWRRVEQGEQDPRAPQVALDWLSRYRPKGAFISRSETVGLVAIMTFEDADLEAHSPGGPEHGHAVLSAGWLLVRCFLLDPQPQFARLHSADVFEDGFRFGVALRDAQIAYDGFGDNAGSDLPADFDAGGE